MIAGICAAPGWWVLAGRPGSFHRTPLAGWALLGDGSVQGLHLWLSDAPVLVEEGEYRHDTQFATCSCSEPTPHSGGLDAAFCIECAGLIDR